MLCHYCSHFLSVGLFSLGSSSASEMTRKHIDLGITNEAFENTEAYAIQRKDTSLSSQSSNVPSIDQKQSKSKKKKSEKEKPEQLPVSLLQLFRFASVADVLIIIVACFCAAASGIALPIVIILYGDLTNSFVNGGLNETYVYNLTCGNISAGANETLP